MDTVTELALVSVPLVVGATELVKRVGVPKRVLPLVVVVISQAIVWLVVAAGATGATAGWATPVLAGLMAALAASGVYSLGKTATRG